MIFLVPVGHDEATVSRMPWVTLGIMGLCLLVQLWATVVWFQLFSLHPADVAAAEELVARHPLWWGSYVVADHGLGRMLTAAFVHGGWMHLIGNMLILYLTGCNVEDRWGYGAYAGFYVAGIVVATLTFAAVHPGFETPLVGASGAVAACMGAFLVQKWGAQVRFAWALIPFGAGTFDAPAWSALILWAVLQVLSTFGEVEGVVTVAHSAHVGGFAFGLLVALVARFSGLEARLDERRAKDSTLFAEDPDFVEAFALVAKAPRDAIPKLTRVLSKDPTHEGARRELSVLAEDPELAPLVLPALLSAALHRQDLGPAVEIFAALRAAGLGARVPERELAELAMGARTVGDANAVVQATRLLMSGYPASNSIPRAMFETVLAQRSAGEPDLARKTLTGMERRFPADPFTAQARAELGADA